jgi:sphingomyelin phosphodiesterase acid-like 3
MLPQMLIRVLLCIFFFFQAWKLPPTASAQGKDSGEYLVISDIHFNPLTDYSLFQALAAQPVSEWNRLFDSSLMDGVSQLGSDTNYVLLQSSFAAAVEKCPRPDFILYPGDSLAHNWKAQYDKVAPRSSDEDPEAYRGFTAKTIAFLALEFRRHFPGVPILPTLGNEDAYCGDYEVQPAGPFLAMFAKAWLELPGPSLDRDTFISNFSRGGHYSIRVPPLFRHRVVVVNSVFFSNQYENSCSSKEETPGKDQMSWLAATVDEASRAGDRVWLMMHIPVGINDYNTVEDEEAGSGPVEFWEPGYTKEFVDLVLKFRQTVEFVFSGHTHMDDFRIIGNGQMPLVVNKLVPSISPIFRNNPGFQIYQYDRASGAVLNYQTYYLSNLSTAGAPTTLEHLEWKLEYDFLSAYGQKALDVSAVTSIARDLQTSGSVQDTYMRFYSVGGPAGFDKLMLPAYSCAILHTAIEEFEKCQSAADNGSRLRKDAGRLPSVGETK